MIALVWLKWFCKLTPRYYSESPEVDTNRVMLEMAALKATRGKFGFVGARPIKHSCRVCGKTFWTERKYEDVCSQWKCYRDYECKKGASDVKANNQ